MSVNLEFLKTLQNEETLEPVIYNILDRKIKMLKGEQIDQNRKIGIVAEGGAMRAVISGGAFIALDFLKLNNVFDIIYGSSAGAINAAYFLSYQIAYGVAVYYQLINNKNFVDLKRLLDFRHNSKIVNMDFLFDEIINKERALDILKVRSSNTSLFMSVTNAEDGSCEFFSNRDLDVNLTLALKAGSAIPVYYNKPVEINGKKYVDGSVANSLPIKEAIQDGCTDILVLLTRPQSYRKSLSNKLIKIYEKYRLNSFSKEFKEQYFMRHIKYNESMDIITQPHRFEKKVNISIVAPESIVARTSTDENSLKNVTMENVKNTLQKFGCKNFDVAEVIQPVLRVKPND